MTGMRENYLQLGINQGTSVFISLMSTSQGNQTSERDTQTVESSILPLDSLDGVKLAETKDDSVEKRRGYPSRASYEIYLQQLFHELLYVRETSRPISTSNRLSSQATKDSSSLLGHFCMSLAHRIFSNKVHMVLQNVVCC